MKINISADDDAWGLEYPEGIFDDQDVYFLVEALLASIAHPTLSERGRRIAWEIAQDLHSLLRDYQKATSITG